jgi:hypothetical protein
MVIDLTLDKQGVLPLVNSDAVLAAGQQRISAGLRGAGGAGNPGRERYRLDADRRSPACRGSASGSSLGVRLTLTRSGHGRGWNKLKRPPFFPLGWIMHVLSQRIETGHTWARRPRSFRLQAPFVSSRRTPRGYRQVPQGTSARPRRRSIWLFDPWVS